MELVLKWLTIDTDATEGAVDTEGGKLGFWLPALMLASTAVSLGGMLENYNANQMAIEYTKKYNAEIARFWNDYYRNTGHRPKYPYKSGAIANEATLAHLYASNLTSASAMMGGIFNNGNADNIRCMYSSARRW